MRRSNPGRGETPPHPIIKSRKVTAPGILPAAGKRLFRQLVADLEPAGLFKPPDRELLGQYVSLVLLAEKALGLLLSEGGVTWDEDSVPLAHGLTVYDGKNQRLAKNPVWQIYSESINKALLLGLKFGITPWARLRMNLASEAEPDDGEDLFDT